MRRRSLWIFVWSIIVVLAAVALLQPKSDRAALAEAKHAEIDPAAMDLGKCDAGAMMAMINSQISLNSR